MQDLRTDAAATADFYELDVARHHEAATVLTSNRSPDEWLAIMIDPLLAQSAVVLPAAYNAHIIDTLGISAGDIVGLEEITLGIVEFAEEAYCPKYATGDY